MWNNLISGDLSKIINNENSASGDPDVMILPLTCKWRQGNPYPGTGQATFNKFCPILTPGIDEDHDEHTIAGCPATAISQILYYWKWPTQGEGNNVMEYPYYYSEDWLSCNEAVLDFNPFDYTIKEDDDNKWPWTDRLNWTDEVYPTPRLRIRGYWDDTLKNFARDLYKNDEDLIPEITEWHKNSYNVSIQAVLDLIPSQEPRIEVIDFDEYTYNWDIMADTWSSANDQGQIEMAEISYHTGVACGIWEGSEFKPYSYGVLGSGCGFENSRNSFVSHFKYHKVVEWIDPADKDLMRKEIQCLRPMLYQGPGHQWVVYGYNKTTDLFMMNMGWAGTHDGWYTYNGSPIPGSPAHLSYAAPINVKFIDKTSFSLNKDGSPNKPWSRFKDALNGVQNGDTIIFKAGDSYPYTLLPMKGGSVKITKQLTIKGHDVTISYQPITPYNKQKIFSIIRLLLEQFFERFPILELLLSNRLYSNL
jgi:hypothetical protein